MIRLPNVICARSSCKYWYDTDPPDDGTRMGRDGYEGGCARFEIYVDDSGECSDYERYYNSEEEGER